MSLSEKISISLANAANGYLNLWGWFSKKLSVATGHSRLRTFPSIIAMWDAILSGDLRSGDQVDIHDVFVTDWIPRAPGALYVKPKDSPLYEVSDYLWCMHQGQGQMTSKSMAVGPEKILIADCEYSPWGLGSVRLPRHHNSPVILGAVSEEPYCCDFGMPIVTTRTVLSELSRVKLKNFAVAADLRGLFIQEPNCSLTRIVRRAGIELPNSLEIALQSSLGLPDCYILIDSLLDVHFMTHDSHPVIFAWTLSERKSEKPLVLVADMCDPSDSESIEFSSSRLKSGELVEGHCEKEYEVIEPTLVDFDGQSIRFAPKISLREDPAMSDPRNIQHLIDLSVRSLPQRKDDNS